MTKRLLTLTLLVAAGAMLAFGAPKKNAPKKEGKKSETAKADTAAKAKPKSKYAEFFKDKYPQTAQGFITLHKTKDKLYFEIPLKVLEKPMLLGSVVSETSDNGMGIVGSKPMRTDMVMFAKKDNNVQLRIFGEQPITDNDDSPLARAIEKSNMGSVIKNMKIEVYNNDSTAVVVDVTDFFVSDNKMMTPFDVYGMYKSMGYIVNSDFQSDKSFLGDIKAFEDNVVIKSTLSYTYDLTNPYTKRSIVSKQPFSTVMSRSLVLLEDDIARPRLADYRVAIFPTVKTYYGEQEQAVKAVFYANRWRLEPSDVEAYKRGEMVTPKKPIVFYIDSDFPSKWVPYITEGVNQWNEMFETIGFKNAIQARPFPKDDPQFDPDNIKYSCVRYAPISIENAMGPSWVDPRSGEIINASVYLYHDIIKLLNNWIFVQTSQADKRVRTMNIPDEIIGDGLRYVVAHEVGHCLGYMHNMGASSNFPVDSLRSASFTQKYGTTPSIMDYARFNYVAQPGDFDKGVKLTPPRFGQYDQFTIEWNYRYYPETASVQQEADLINEFTEKKLADPIYRWGAQGNQGMDPRSQSEDLGDDAIKASKYGMKNLKYIMDNYDKWVGDQDVDFEFRQEIYYKMLLQYMGYFSHVYSSVGGVYLNEVKAGDSLPRFKSVEAVKQQKSLQYAFELYNDLDWLENREVNQNIGIIGSAKPLLSLVLARALVTAPLRVIVSAKLSDEKNTYDYNACIKDFMNFTWKAALNGTKPTIQEKELQDLSISAYAQFSGLTQMAGTSAIAISQNHEVFNFKTNNIIDIAYKTPIQILAEVDQKNTFGISAPMLETGINNPYAIYGNVFGRYGRLTSVSTEAYSYLLKVKALLPKAIANAPDAQTKAHYELMLRNINTAMKVN